MTIIDLVLVSNNEINRFIDVLISMTFLSLCYFMYDLYSISQLIENDF